jgi:glycosyltransferase involved in cell wall biosynthesis
MIKPSSPLISCLCVTNKRPHFLKRAIACFSGQSYPQKEMIIVCPEDDRGALDYISSLKNEQLIPVTVPAGHQLTLGELRNISLEHSNGEYFCQWDDDDWSHRDRLRIQFNNLAANQHPVTMLTNVLMYDAASGQAYFSHFRLWDQTIMGTTALRGRVQYQSLERSEDREFSHLLLAESKIYPTVSHNSYIYVYHGSNTWDKDHFNWLFGQAQPLSAGLSQLIGDILDGKYSVTEASELLGLEDLLQEINYFYYEKKMIQQQKDEAKLQAGEV